MAASAQSTGAGTLFSLEPDSRAWLHARIGQRFAEMLASGLLDEVRRLRQRGDLHPDLPAMRCVGYRQAWQALDEGQPSATLHERGSAATRQLAKRQLTWLRSLPRQRLPAERPDLALQTLLATARALPAV